MARTSNLLALLALAVALAVVCSVVLAGWWLARRFIR